MFLRILRANLYESHFDTIRSSSLLVDMPRVSETTDRLAHTIIKPPDTVRNMTSLDKSKFASEATISCLNVQAKTMNSVLKEFRSDIFKMRLIKPVQHRLPKDSGRVSILLNPTRLKTWLDIDEPRRTRLQKLSVTKTDFEQLNVSIGYDNYTHDEIFRAILPTNEEGFSSFSQIGHIVHVNLREHLFAFKSLIGQVLLDKIPTAKTVVNKIDTIDNSYRNFRMELLCGNADDTFVSIKENNNRFEFDFSKIYWNPRLGSEHQRIVDMLQSDDVLFDVFAGVGPFAIPAAKKGCVVFANDLNPDSFKWLNHNAKINKVKLESFNKDGHNFILNDVKSHLGKFVNRRRISIAMNLPALAVEFLSDFKGLLRGEFEGNIEMPILAHVYCFTKGENSCEIATRLLIDQMGSYVESKIVNVYNVRTVSNMKEMIRITIRLDEDTLLLQSWDEKKRRHSSGAMDWDVTKKFNDGKEQEQKEQSNQKASSQKMQDKSETSKKSIEKDNDSK